MSKEPSTPFLGLFECGDKRELRRYCRDLIVSRVDLALFILSCRAEALPFVHHIHYQDRIPTNLRPSTDELAALGGGVVGKPLRGDALKAVKK